MNIDKILQNKKLMIVAVVVIAVALIVGIVLMVNSQTTHFPDVDDGPGEEVNEKSLVFYNRDLLTAAYNIDFSAEVLDDIQAVVFSGAEMKFSKNNTPIEEDPEIYYDAIINIGSFQSYDAYACGFDVEISDGRQYKVVVGTDSLSEDYTFVYTAIERVGGDEIYVQVTGERAELEAFLNFVKGQLGDKKMVELVEVTEVNQGEVKENAEAE